MKKLLGLLSVLTISGTAIPTTIAASYYQKEKNNLENLIRGKRQSTVSSIISTTTAIPNTNYSIGHCDVILRTNPQRWGNAFRLEINSQLSRIISGLTSENTRDILISIVTALGGSAVGGLTSNDPLIITLSGVIPGVVTLFSLFVNRYWPNNQQRQSFINLFRNNDVSNGVNLLVNEDNGQALVRLTSITSTSSYHTCSS